jgi:hypothetical protein
VAEEEEQDKGGIVGPAALTNAIVTNPPNEKTNEVAEERSSFWKKKRKGCRLFSLDKRSKQYKKNGNA